MSSNRVLLALVLSGALACGVAACGGADEPGGSSEHSVTGTIAIDGSSTVFPFAEAAAELFNEEHPDVNIAVGQSGTGGGIEKFCAGEIDIATASRPIERAEEAPECKRAGIRYGEVQVANDGVAVVTNKGLVVDCLTTGQLERLWDKGSRITSLAQLGAGLPDTRLSLYGPGTDSGTFDFFTERINGAVDVSREDYEASEDDNQLVTGVAGDAGGLGYFGFSFYEANRSKLNLVGVGADPDSCVKPSARSIQDGTYEPLSRPLFMYTAAKSLATPAVKAFMDFVVDRQEAIAAAAKMVALTPRQAGGAKRAIARAEREAGA